MKTKTIAIKKHFLLFLFLVTAVLCSEAQFLKISGTLGSAQGEMKYQKKQMLYSEIVIGYETKIKAGFFSGFIMDIAAGIATVKFDFYDSSFNAIYNNKKFIALPVTLKKYFRIQASQYASCFVGFGIAGNYFFKDKKEIKNYSNSIIQRKNGTGINVGFIGNLGLRLNLSSKKSLEFSFSRQEDIMSTYNNEMDKIKFKKNLFSLAFIKSLSKS